MQNSESSQTGDIDVHYRVSDSGSHTGFLTSSPLMSMITIPNSRSNTITVTINRDGTVGGDGQITVELLPGEGYKLGTNASRNVAIPAHSQGGTTLPVITVTGVTVTEGGATQNITFSLDKVAPAGGVTITAAVDTGNSVALENTDFTLSTKTVSIASGSQNGSITVTAVSDSLYEGADETFTLTLTATGANFSDTSNNSSTVSSTIMESDNPPVITVSSPVQADNPGTFNFVVTKTGNTTQSVSIAYVVADTSTAIVDTDFRLGTAGPLVIAAADSSGVIPITILTDTTLNETEDTIVLTLTLTHAIFDDGSANGTNTGMATAILTDLPIASIATNYSEVADSDYFTYNVTLDPAPSGTESVTVNLTLPDTSSFPLTYENVGTLVFATGETRKSGRINITETYASKSGATESNFEISIATGTGYTPHADNDNISVGVKDGSGFPAVEVSRANNTPITEGGTYDVLVNITPGTHSEISLNHSAADTGTVSGYYQATNVGGSAAANPYVVSANAGSVTFSIVTNDQATLTGHGEITFEVLPGAGYKLSSNSDVQTTIVDSEAPTVNIPSGNYNEDSGSNSVDITATSRTSGDDITVNFELDTATSTATWLDDFRITLGSASGTNVQSGQFMISDSSSTINLFITIETDTEIEDDETIVINFTSPDGIFSNNSNTIAVTYTINRQLRELTLSNTNAQTFEGGEILFTVEITPPPTSAVTIPIEAVDMNSMSQTVTPTGGVVVNPAPGEASSSATGRVTVANSGVMGPITIKVADSITNYNFNPKIS